MTVAVLGILWFVVLGLGLVVIGTRAMLGSRADARETRVLRRAWGPGMAILLIVLGVAIPAAGVVRSSSADERIEGGIELTQAQVSGRQMFAHSCSTCHTLSASNAAGMVGPNLDAMRPNETLILDAVAHGRARGQGQMPAGLATGQDAKDVAAYVSAVAGR